MEDGIEGTVMEVVEAAADGAVIEGIEGRGEACLPTTGGRTSLRIATMARGEAEVEAVAEMTAEEEEEEESGTVTTGPNLSPGMRGWRRNSSTRAMDPQASTLTGEHPV